jgi:hypothetical protein
MTSGFYRFGLARLAITSGSADLTVPSPPAMASGQVVVPAGYAGRPTVSNDRSTLPVAMPLSFRGRPQADRIE